MNTLSAIITDITCSHHLSSLLVSAEDEPFFLLLAETSGARTGEKVILAFKETEVILAKTISLSTANTQRAHVTNIEKGSVLTQVTLSFHNATITALIPTLTFDPLDIGIGDEIYWLVNPSEISLLRGE